MAWMYAVTSGRGQLATLGSEPRLFNAVLAQDDLPIQILCGTTKAAALLQCAAMRKDSA